MPDDVLAVDLPDGATLLILDCEVQPEEGAQLRRELRLWARSDSRAIEEATRSSSAAVLGQAAETLGVMIASGVVGNAAWAAFPKAAELLERVGKRERIKDAAELAERLRTALSPDPMSTIFELVQAHQLATGGWNATVRVDTRTLTIATDRSGNIVLWCPAADI